VAMSDGQRGGDAFEFSLHTAVNRTVRTIHDTQPFTLDGMFHVFSCLRAMVHTEVRIFSKS